MLEIACFNNRSACLAEEAGADRIELCADYAVGGITPRLEDCLLLRNQVQIPIFVMNRPRGGSFVYTEAELTKMRDDMLRFKDIADGFVFGVLNESGKVDVAQNTVLITLASPKSCTFHRAFDQTPDLLHALEEVIRCGFQTILTSGGQSSAVTGVNTIERLVERSQGRIAIMPGGGIRSSNIKDLKSAVGSRWFHSAAITDRGEIADVNEIRELKALSQYNLQYLKQIYSSSDTMVRRTIQFVAKYGHEPSDDSDESPPSQVKRTKLHNQTSYNANQSISISNQTPSTSNKAPSTSTSMSSNNTNNTQTYYSSSSYSSYSSTSNGQTTSYREASRTDPSGTTVARESREPGQAPVQERYHVPTSGSGAIGGGPGARGTGGAQGRIEEVTEEEKDAGKRYEETMEEEYAKREGGA
ncbi:MAG: hypothetical protein Q9165_007831 [Trypethelium subeluteriae]